MIPEQLSLLDETAVAPPAQHDTSRDWQIRVSKRARSIKIQVFPHGGVEVVVPRRTRPAEVQEFVAAHAEWIEQTRADFRRRRPAETLLPDTLLLPAVNEHWTVRYTTTRGPARATAARAAELNIAAASLSPQACWPVLRGWLKARGRAVLPDQVAALGELTGLRPARVQVRLQRTRWGSCSASGTVSLNAALLLQSPEQMRYVLIHELCHLRHLNHSRRFWALVRSFVPDYRALDRELDQAWQQAPAWLIG